MADSDTDDLYEIDSVVAYWQTEEDIAANSQFTVTSSSSQNTNGVTATSRYGGFNDPRTGSTSGSIVCPVCKLVKCSGHYSNLELSDHVFAYHSAGDLRRLLRSVCWCCSMPRLQLSQNYLDDLQQQGKTLWDVEGTMPLEALEGDVDDAIISAVEEARHCDSDAVLGVVANRCTNTKWHFQRPCQHCGARQPLYTYNDKIGNYLYQDWSKTDLTPHERFICAEQEPFLPRHAKAILRRIPNAYLRFLGFNVDASHPHNIIVNKRTVPPPASRPTTRAGAASKHTNDGLTVLLKQCLKNSKENIKQRDKFYRHFAPFKKLMNEKQELERALFSITGVPHEHRRQSELQVVLKQQKKLMKLQETLDKTKKEPTKKRLRGEIAEIQAALQERSGKSEDELTKEQKKQVKTLKKKLEKLERTIQQQRPLFEAAKKAYTESAHDLQIAACCIEDEKPRRFYTKRRRNDNRNGNNAGNASRSTLKGILSKKDGLFRENMMGKRVDHSARGTIVPAGVELDAFHLGIPQYVALTNTVQETVTAINITALQQRVRKGHVLGGAATIIKGNPVNHRNEPRVMLGGCTQEQLEEHANGLQLGWTVERPLQNGDLVLFNRQPSLHKYSFMGYYAVIMPDNVFRLPPCCTKPYNADFDGDEMTLHVIQTVDGRFEVMDLLLMPHNIMNKQKNAPVLGLIQDSLDSAWVLSDSDTFLRPQEMMQLLMAMRYNPKKTEEYAEAVPPVIDFDTINANLTPQDVAPPAIYARDPASGAMKAYYTGKQVFNMLLPNISMVVGDKRLGSVTRAKDKATSLFSTHGNSQTLDDGNVVVLRGELLVGQLGKRMLGASSGGFIHEIHNRIGKWAAAKFISDAQRVMIESQKQRPVSIGLSDGVPASKEVMDRMWSGIREQTDEIERLERGRPADAQYAESAEALKNATNYLGGMILKSMDRDNGLSVLPKSGAKAISFNISQMVALIGQKHVCGKRLLPHENVARKRQRTLPLYPADTNHPETQGFIASNYGQGLDIAQEYQDAMGGRKGLVDSATRVAEPGYAHNKIMRTSESTTTRQDITVRNAGNVILETVYGGDGLNPGKLCKVGIKALWRPVAPSLRESIATHKKHEAGAQDVTKRLSQLKKTDYDFAELLVTLLRGLLSDSNNLQAEFIGQTLMPLNAPEVLRDYSKRKEGDIMCSIPEMEAVAADALWTIWSEIAFPVQRIPPGLAQEENHKLQLVQAATGELQYITSLRHPDKLVEQVKASFRVDGMRKTRLLLAYWMTPAFVLAHAPCITRANFKAYVQKILSATIAARANPGDPSGSEAMNSISEPTTQMTLNTFHFSGAKDKNVAHGSQRYNQLIMGQDVESAGSFAIVPDTTSGDLLMRTLLGVSIHELFMDARVVTLESTLQPQECDFWPQVSLSAASQYDTPEMLPLPTPLHGIHALTLSKKPKPVKKTDAKYNAWEPIWCLKLSLMPSKLRKHRVSLPWVAATLQAMLGSYFIMHALPPNMVLVKLCKPCQNEMEVLQELMKRLTSFIISGFQQLRSAELTTSTRVLNGELRTMDTVAFNGSCLGPTMGALSPAYARYVYSHNVNQVLEVLGLEAGYQCLLREFRDLFSFDGTYTDPRHISLFVTSMLQSGDLAKVYRTQLYKYQASILAQAAFETAVPMTHKAATFGITDNLQGVASNIIVGQIPPVGTGTVTVLTEDGRVVREKRRRNIANSRKRQRIAPLHGKKQAHNAVRGFVGRLNGQPQHFTHTLQNGIRAQCCSFPLRTKPLLVMPQPPRLRMSGLKQKGEEDASTTIIPMKAEGSLPTHTTVKTMSSLLSPGQVTTQQVMNIPMRLHGLSMDIIHILTQVRDALPANVFEFSLHLGALGSEGFIPGVPRELFHAVISNVEARQAVWSLVDDNDVTMDVYYSARSGKVIRTTMKQEVNATGNFDRFDIIKQRKAQHGFVATRAGHTGLQDSLLPDAMVNVTAETQVKVEDLDMIVKPKIVKHKHRKTWRHGPWLLSATRCWQGADFLQAEQRMTQHHDDPVYELKLEIEDALEVFLQQRRSVDSVADEFLSMLTYLYAAPSLTRLPQFYKE